MSHTRLKQDTAVGIKNAKKKKKVSASLSTLLYNVPVSCILLLPVHSHVAYFQNLLCPTLQIQYSIQYNTEHFVMAGNFKSKGKGQLN
jgi:hypothetical protein